jgi:hypothetical protein
MSEDCTLSGYLWEKTAHIFLDLSKNLAGSTVEPAVRKRSQFNGYLYIIPIAREELIRNSWDENRHSIFLGVLRVLALPPVMYSLS